MSHHIDDIFKKNLQHASLEGHEKDWSEAKILLGLNKSKKRFPVWLWFGIGLLLASSLFGIYFSQKQVTQIIPLNNQIENSSNENASPYSQLSDDNIDKKLLSELPGLTSNILSNNNELKSDANMSQSKNPTEKANRINFNVENVSVEPISSSINIASATAKNTSPFFEETSQKPNPQTNPLAQSNERPPNIPSSQPDTYVNNNSIIKNVAVTLKPKMVPTISGNSFDQIEIKKFNIAQAEVTLPEQVEIKNEEIVDDKDVGFNLSPGIYFAYDPFQENFSGGVLLNHNFNARWSINVGVGLRHMSSTEMISYSGTVAINNTELISNNAYKSSSIELPIRISRHFDKHSIFIGGLIERPFVLNGTQEVTVSQERDVVDVPALDPGLSPTVAQPFYAVQDYNINAVPNRKRLFYYGQLGYGYNFHSRFQISAIASYRLNSQTIVSPLVRTAQQSIIQESALNFEMRLSYIF